MGIIKEDATLLTEEGELVSNVKGVGDVDYEMDAYTKDLERIISRKIKMYKELKTKLDIYKLFRLHHISLVFPHQTLLFLSIFLLLLILFLSLFFLTSCATRLFLQPSISK